MNINDKKKEVLVALERIKKCESAIDKRKAVWNFLKTCGVDERILNNPNTHELGMDLDFDSFVESLYGGSISLSDNGVISISSNFGSSPLVHEGKMVNGIESNLVIKNGEVHMSCAYKRDNFHALKKTYDMVVVSYGEEYVVRTRKSDYLLESEYNREKNCYETQGSGYSTVSDFDQFGIEIAQNNIGYGNKPTIIVNSYSGIDLNDIWIQERFSRESAYGNQDLKSIMPGYSCSDKRSPFFMSERMSRRLEIDKVQSSTWDKDNMNWDVRYLLPLTGEHDIAILLNNSEFCSSLEELDELRTERLENGWYDRKIDEYQKEGRQTASVIACLLKEQKMKLEEQKIRNL